MEREVATEEALLRARLRGFVRDRPWLAVAAAAAAGGLLGGVWFSRAGRLVFAATTGFVAHDLWHREGKLAVDDVVAKLSRDDHREARPASASDRHPAAR
jgi:hypothetical protein